MWSGCLSRSRIEEPNEDDINLLETRRLALHAEKDLTNSYHVFYTRYEVSTYNENKLQALHTPLAIVDAILSYPEHYKPKIDSSGAIDSTNFKKVKICFHYC